VRLIIIGALLIVIPIEALVVFLSTLKTFQFPFTLACTMSELLKEIRKKISHTLRRSDSSDSPVQKSYARVAKRVFSSVEAQAMFTWIEDTEKPTRLTVKPKEKIVTPSH
jgi:energy-converting hydrogenase Eha subunit H